MNGLRKATTTGLVLWAICAAAGANTGLAQTTDDRQTETTGRGDRRIANQASSGSSPTPTQQRRQRPTTSETRQEAGTIESAPASAVLETTQNGDEAKIDPRTIPDSFLYDGIYPLDLPRRIPRCKSRIDGWPSDLLRNRTVPELSESCLSFV